MLLNPLHSPISGETDEYMIFGRIGVTVVDFASINIK